MYRIKQCIGKCCCFTVLFISIDVVGYHNEKSIVCYIRIVEIGRIELTIHNDNDNVYN